MSVDTIYWLKQNYNLVNLNILKEIIPSNLKLTTKHDTLTNKIRQDIDLKNISSNEILLIVEGKEGIDYLEFIVYKKKDNKFLLEPLPSTIVFADSKTINNNLKDVSYLSTLWSKTNNTSIKDTGLYLINNETKLVENYSNCISLDDVIKKLKQYNK